MSSQNHSAAQRRRYLQEFFGLAEEPSEELMSLLSPVCNADLVSSLVTEQWSQGNHAVERADITSITGAVAALLACACKEADVAIAAVGETAGVSQAEIRQLQQQEHVALSTLVRLASACGYRVTLTLDSVGQTRATLSTSLSIAPRTDAAVPYAGRLSGGPSLPRAGDSQPAPSAIRRDV